MKNKKHQHDFLKQIGLVSVTSGAIALAFGATHAIADNGSVKSQLNTVSAPAAKRATSSFDTMLRADFAQYRETTFRTPYTYDKREKPGKGLVELTLVSMRIEKGDDPKRGIQVFSLIFKGPQHKRLAQTTHTFTHGKLGKLNMLIIPRGILHGNILYYVKLRRSTSR